MATRRPSKEMQEQRGSATGTALRGCFLLALALVFWTSAGLPVGAAESSPAAASAPTPQGQGEAGSPPELPLLTVGVGEQKRLPAQGAARYLRMKVEGAVGIVEVVIIPQTLVLHGKREGEVVLHVWSRDEKGQAQQTAYKVRVGPTRGEEKGKEGREGDGSEGKGTEGDGKGKGDPSADSSVVQSIEVTHQILDTSSGKMQPVVLARAGQQGEQPRRVVPTARQEAPPPTATTPEEKAGTESGSEAEVTIERPAQGTRTFLQHLTVSGKAPDQATLTLTINDTVVGVGVSGQQEAGRYEFVNVSVLPGRQTIIVTAKTAEGQEFSARTEIHVQGPPARVTIEGPVRAPADARTVSTYTVKLVDAWDQPIPEGTFVTVVTEGGLLEVQDADPNTAGVQVRPEGGVATVGVKSPNAARLGVLRAVAGDLVATRGIRFYTPDRPFIVVGLVSSAVGHLSDSKAGAPTGVDTGFFNENRLGLFARGTLEDGYLVTGAYDSQRNLQDRLFKELDPDRMYPVFGDTSSVFYEAQSRDHFYLQVEKDDTLYRYGDFFTDLAPSFLGAYQRPLTGVQVQRKTSRGANMMFAARTSQSFERAEIRGNGTSGYYFLPRPPVIVGSERIAVEVRDRDRPQVVLSSEPRTRLIDYDIDYQQGSIFFRQPVPGIDANQNPVYIVATYESDAPGKKRLIVGFRNETQTGNLTAGTTLVHEERSGSGYILGSADLSLQLPSDTVLSAEYAQTVGEKFGWAWRMELQSAPAPGLRLQAYMRSTDQDFDNLSTPLFELGSIRRGLDVNYEISPRESALFKYYRQSGNQLSLSTTSARYRRDFDRAKAELELLRQDYGNSLDRGTGESTLLSGKVLYPLKPDLDLYLQREEALSGENPLRPEGTTLGIDYQLMPQVKILVREKLTDEGQNITSVGVSSQLLKGTSLTSTYEINSVANGGYNQASVGLNTTLSLAPFLTGNLAYERVNVFGGGTSYDSASASLEYKPDDPFTGSLKVERRHAGSDTQTSLTVGATGRLARDLSVLVRHTEFDQGQTLGALAGVMGLPTRRTSIGLAYRPADDVFNFLARYQIREDLQGQILGSAGTESWAELGSLEGIYQPRSDLQLSLKYAFRNATTSFDGVKSHTLTDLWLARLTHDLSARWNVSGEFRRLRQHESDTEQFGWGLEFGYILRPDLIIGFGYNFAGQEDRQLSLGRRWAEGPYVRADFKFDEYLGREEP